MNENQLNYLRNPHGGRALAWMAGTDKFRGTGRSHAMIARAIGEALWLEPGEFVILTDHVPKATYDMIRHLLQATVKLLREHNITCLNVEPMIRYRGRDEKKIVGTLPDIGQHYIRITRR